MIDDYKAANTWLYVLLSTNDYGTFPLRLRSCLDSVYFDTILNAWGLDSAKDDVAAVTVKFEWLDQAAFVLREDVNDSWLKVIEVINEALVWEKDKGRCDVKVKIIMR